MWQSLCDHSPMVSLCQGKDRFLFLLSPLPPVRYGSDLQCDRARDCWDFRRGPGTERLLSTALDTVKCEIPPITTVMTSRDSDISRIVYTKGCVTDLFLELTGLLREQSIKHQACLNMHMKVRNTTTPVGVHQCLRLTLQTFPQPFKMILKERYKLKSVGLIR